MKTSLNNIAPGEIELRVELDGEEIKRYLTEAEDKLSADIEIDGFRKGKAPKEVVRKKIGEAAILQAGLENAVEKSFSRAISEQGMDVISTSDLKVEENTPEKLTYTVKAILYPSVKVGDFSKVKVKRKDVGVTDEEISQAVESIRSSRAVFEPKETGVEMGDRVEIDFQVKKDGLVIEGGESKNHPLVVGKETFIPGFEANLIGMQKGETKTFNLKVPKDYFHKDIAGKEVECVVTVNVIQKVVLPEFTDEFVKTIGKFETAQHLRDSIKEGMILEKRSQESDRARLEALNEILNLTEMVIPQAMIENQLDTMLAEFDHSLHAKGLELGFYLAHIGKTQDDLRKDWRKDAERQVKTSLLVRQIAKDKNISVSDAEVEETANEVIQNLVSRGQSDISNIDIKRLKENVAQKIINERTLEFIEGICVE